MWIKWNACAATEVHERREGDDMGYLIENFEITEVKIYELSIRII